VRLIEFVSISLNPAHEVAARTGIRRSITARRLTGRLGWTEALAYANIGLGCLIC
jgi:hypothetical protein